MNAFEVLGVVSLLLATIGIGTMVHELTHALILRILGVSYRTQWFPRSKTISTLDVMGPLATVTPMQVRENQTWGIRFAALAPLVLAAPLLGIAFGFLPDPFEAGNVYGISLTVAWAACTIPSPQDFSLFWYPEQILEEVGGEAQTSEPVEYRQRETEEPT